MGRRKNNPELVQELIDSRWDMDQEEFEQKYFSLSQSDMFKVARVIDGMEAEWMSDDEEEKGCTACGNPAYPHCKTSCPMFDD